MTDIITNKDIRDIALENIASHRYGYDLYYIDHSDHLTDEQVRMVIDRDDDLVGDVLDNLMDMHAISTRFEVEQEVRDAVRELVDGDDEDEAFADFEYTPEWEDVQQAVWDRDESDPIGDLARGTSDPLVQWVHPGGETILAVPDADDEDVREALRALGLHATDANVAKVRDALNECHDEVDLRVIFTVDLAQMLDHSVSHVRLTHPTLLCVNGFDGSGMDTEPMDGAVSVPRDQIRLDSDLGYASWDAIAGVVISAYEAEATEYVRLCEYVPEGVDTDGTRYYRCLSHNSVEISPDAHCAEAVEPAYAVLITTDDEED